MAGLRHQAKGGFDRGGFQVAMTIAGPAWFCCHTPSYKGISQNATAGTRSGLSCQADARLATRSLPYCGVMSSSMTVRIILMTAPRARPLVAAWAAMLSVL